MANLKILEYFNIDTRRMGAEIGLRQKKLLHRYIDNLYTLIPLQLSLFTRT